ncbi:preprotein translocase subunit SecA [Hippea maritima]|uniref:Protein translocase subunit SecA n=1 Tax=Hippea maritima (strain ATCC 700847 / DSM 10411 / MH2) TaxID=760142 RepID=F2LUQ2_HIPMA|nr:preprotein translocase subunit SecA [Hippea maritima]AEA33507.1 Protein translocase subunit secA [Hippea maritima DSM 10411]
MLSGLMKKIFGTQNDRILKSIKPVVDKVNDKESWAKSLSDDGIREELKKLENRYHEKGKLDDILVDSFALTRETARRTLNMRHFDVQLIGGYVLHKGMVAEMKTGEGKTLVATLPLVLNAMTKRGVHLVTVNDYLAKRDALWMAPIYLFLGFSVGVIQQQNKSFLVEWDDKEKFTTKLTPCSRKEAYLADITYGTNSEFGFDYLRDNMSYSLDEYVQRDFYYAIVDEVDSILIDEARTPLIISGVADRPSSLYYKVDKAVRQLKPEDYEVDEKVKNAVLTDSGVEKVQKFLGIDNLYDIENIEILHMVNQALKAHTVYLKDKDYIVKDGKAIIVDEFTGRLMPDRRYSDGLHQAIEAKEHLRIQKESQTLASITFQNYFRMYEKLAGMTGTAATEAREFKEIYNLEVVVIPTNKPIKRIDHNDLVFKTHKEKINAIINEIEERYKKGQPVLVGTTSVEKSEELHKILSRKRIPHSVLNAKHHEKEAEIIAHAGEPKRVTIATNMAGRGVDIKLTPESKELGGLFILGTERHESRRIDNQLRGRSGRQGDPGESRFFLSLEDDLLRIFGSERIKLLMDRLGVEEGEAIENRMITRAIENAQKKVEAYNFEIRKNLLEYDDVMNKQRQVIYQQRRSILEGKDLKDDILGYVDSIVDDLASAYLPDKVDPTNWDIDGFNKEIRRIFDRTFDIDAVELSKTKQRHKMLEDVKNQLKDEYNSKEELIGNDEMRNLERQIMLQVVDMHWREHLKNMDYLRDAVGLRGYGQRDPLVEYKKVSFDEFEEMVKRIQEDTVASIYHIRIVVE